MMRRTGQPAQRLPDDLIEGLESRLSSKSLPQARLPEIVELRAIGLRLIGHINALEEEQRMRMDLEGLGV